MLTRRGWAGRLLRSGEQALQPGRICGLLRLLAFGHPPPPAEPLAQRIPRGGASWQFHFTAHFIGSGDESGGPSIADCPIAILRESGIPAVGVKMPWPSFWGHFNCQGSQYSGDGGIKGDRGKLAPAWLAHCSTSPPWGVARGLRA